MKQTLETNFNGVKANNSNIDPDIKHSIEISLNFWIEEDFNIPNPYDKSEWEKVMNNLSEEALQVSTDYQSDYLIYIRATAWEAKARIMEATNIYHQIAKVVEILNHRKNGKDWDRDLLELLMFSYENAKPSYSFDWSDDLNLVRKLIKLLINNIEKYWSLKYFITAYLEFFDCYHLIDTLFKEWEYQYQLTKDNYPFLELDGLVLDLPSIYKFHDKPDRKYLHKLVNKPLRTPFIN